MLSPQDNAYIIVEEVPMEIYCILCATEKIKMEVPLKISNSRFPLALAYNGISNIKFSKALDLQCIFGSTWS